MKPNYLFKTLAVLLFGSSMSWAQTTFNYTGNIQTYTVPGGVSVIQIEAYGAEGGTSTGQSGGMNWYGGKGAYVSGEFNVTPGQVLDILVGEQGANGNCGSGGGGGSFVESSGVLMVVAGGGGGGFHCNALGGVYGGDGSINEAGDQGICTPNRFPQPGGTNGMGGTSYYGGGGGGYYGAGIGQVVAASGGGQYPGSAGGTIGGGYGGGGGYYTSCCGGSGGGGGYSGGGGGQTDGCAGGGGGSYNDGTNQTITAGIQPGNGMVIISEVCSALTVTPPSTLLCEGDNITLSASSTNGGTVTWDNGVMDGVAFAPPVGTTTYTATSTDPNDCAYSIDITVNAAPAATMSALSQMCFYDNAFQLTSGSPSGGTYSGNGVISDVFDPGSAGIGTHTITYTITDPSTGCSGSDNVDIVIDECLSLDEIDQNISIYPNPTSGTFKIELDGEFQYSVSNVLGEKIIDRSATDKAKVRLSNLPNGTYLVRVTANGLTSVKRIVKQ